MYRLIAIGVIVVALGLGFLLYTVGEALFGLTNGFSRYSFTLSCLAGIVGAVCMFVHGAAYTVAIPDRLTAEAEHLRKVQQGNSSGVVRQVIDYKVDLHNQDCYAWADCIDKQAALFLFEDMPDVSAFLIN